MASVEYFEKVKEAQNSLHEKERSRLQLEREMSVHFKSERQQAKLKAVKLKSYWKKICDNQKASQQRNEQVLADLERISRHMTTLSARSDRLKLMKQQYSDYIDRTYPKWRELVDNFKINGHPLAQPPSDNDGDQDQSRDNRKTNIKVFPMRQPAEKPLLENSENRRFPPSHVVSNENPVVGRNVKSGQYFPDSVLDQQSNVYNKFQADQESESLNKFENVPHGFSKPTSSFQETQESAQLIRSGLTYRNESSPEPHIETQIGLKDNISDIWSDDDHVQASDSRQEETIQGVTKAVVTKMLSEHDSPTKVETPRSIHSAPSKSEDSSMKADLSLSGLINSLRYLEEDITGKAYSEESVEGFYRTKQPNLGLRNAIINEANSGDMESTVELDGEAVSMVILEQLTLVIRSTELGCVFPDILLRADLSNVRDQEDLKSVLPEQVVSIWNELFNHFSILLRHKVMAPNEIAAVFVPCIVTETCQHQTEAYTLLVTVLEAECLKFTGDTESISMFSHRVETKGQTKKTLEVPRLRINSLSEKAVTDEDSSFFDQSIPSSKQHVPLNETSAYKAITGHHVHQQSEDTDDDVEKQFASVLSPSQTPRSARTKLSASVQVHTKASQEPGNENLSSAVSSESSPATSVAHTKGAVINSDANVTSFKNSKPINARDIISNVKISDFDTDTEMDINLDEKKQDEYEDEFDFYD